VIVDDEPFWKLSAVPELIRKQRETLKDILTGPLIPDEDLEEFQTHDLLVQEWPKQRELLKGRIAEADVLYQKLLDRASKQSQSAAAR
jgi:hypothetical protein